MNSRPSATQSSRNSVRSRTTRTTAFAALAVTLTTAAATSAASSASAQDWGVVSPAPENITPTTRPRSRPTAPPTTKPPATTVDPHQFRQAIERVENMPFDRDLLARAGKHGLNIVNVTWEDTGRDIGSSGGPNISDLTLQVREPQPGGRVETHLLPVLRYPNFTDKTADIKTDKLWVRVGNQTTSGAVETVPLSEVLGNLKWYLSDPNSLPGSGNFLAKRDSHLLVSAQHVFMPLPKTGKAEFTPVLYNYQSSVGAPAVLTLLVTRQGTSATIIENYDGDQSYQQWGQQLFFNNRGQRTTFTAERRSSVKSRVESGGGTADDKASLAKGADMVMIVQVPLKVYRPEPNYDGDAANDAAAPDAESAPAAGAVAPSAPSAPSASKKKERSNVETAVIGHGNDDGPFREMKYTSIERDTTFPIRVTVQFYKATSNGVVSNGDLAEAKQQIDAVYGNGDYVGSLVVPDGAHSRPTAWARARTPFRQ
jgi:hypothetical protein